MLKWASMMPSNFVILWFNITTMLYKEYNSFKMIWISPRLNSSMYLLEKDNIVNFAEFLT